MKLREQLESAINELVDGRILLSEAVEEFEKLYIQAAMLKYADHVSNTAAALGIHRNTLAKRLGEYAETARKNSKKRNGKRRAGSGLKPHGRK